MVMRVKRPLVPGIIPPCLITCVCIPVETGRAPSHLLKMVFKLPSDDGRRSTLRLYNWVIFPSFYATSRVAKYSLGMVIFRIAIFENLKCCVSGVNRVRLAGL